VSFQRKDSTHECGWRFTCSIQLYSILLLLDEAVLLRLELSWPLINFFVSDTLLEAKAKAGPIAS